MSISLNSAASGSSNGKFQFGPQDDDYLGKAHEWMKKISDDIIAAHRASAHGAGGGIGGGDPQSPWPAPQWMPSSSGPDNSVATPPVSGA